MESAKNKSENIAWIKTRQQLQRCVKRLENKDRWKIIKDKLDKLAKEECIKNDTFLQVLLRMKRVFNKTPISLKIASKKEDLYYRELALYLLVNYSNASNEEISSEFKIELSSLEEYKSKEDYEKIYKKLLEEYFKEKIITYAFEQDCHIGFWDWISDEKFQELVEQIIKISKESK